MRQYAYAYAAVSPVDGVLDSLVLPEASTEAGNIFLAEVSAGHPDEFMVMVLDGASWLPSPCSQRAGKRLVPILAAVLAAAQPRRKPLG
ncbi:MAG: hypothetical protein IH608_01960 [Proteobacteria bacterium]|nr:hypothetical protein [Pseudomonadota bacterium]